MRRTQRRAKGQPPYDVAGWTLPMLLGVRRVEVMQSIDIPGLRRVTDADDAVSDFAGDPRESEDDAAILSSFNSDTWDRIARRLAAGERWTFVASGTGEGLFLRGAVSGSPDDVTISLEGLPRIGVYSPWRGNMDEGWMRYVLDTFGFPFVTVRNEMLRAGVLNDFLDVLIIPHSSTGQLDQGRPEGSVPDEYTGGLAPEGAVAVEEFVRGGGKLITVGGSCRWAVDLFGLPVIDVTREPAGESFSCPGSVLRGIPTSDDSINAGLPASLALFFSRGSGAWRAMTETERSDADIEDLPLHTLLRYAPTRVLLSGWILGPEVIQGHGAWLQVEYGEGTINLFGFRPQYRGWSQAAFHLLFRAILLNRPHAEPGEQDEE